jgi:hypothetical protein
MIDCDPIESEYDFQGVYYWGQDPVVEEPQVDFGSGSETYKRLPTPRWPLDWE